MTDVESVVFQLVLEEQVAPVMLNNDPPFEVDNVILVVQVGSGGGRRLQEDEEGEKASYNKIDLLVKAKCGGKNECSDDNLESFLVENAGQVVSSESFRKQLVETETLVQAIIAAECGTIRACASERLAAIDQAEGTGTAVAVAQLEVVITKQLLENGEPGLSPEEAQNLTEAQIQERVSAIKETMLEDVQDTVDRKEQNGAASSYFSQIQDYGVSDSASGILPPIKLPPVSESSVPENVEEEESIVGMFILVMLVAYACIVTMCMACGCCFSQKRGQKSASIEKAAEEKPTIRRGMQSKQTVVSDGGLSQLSVVPPDYETVEL